MKIVFPFPDSKVFPNAKRAVHWTRYRKVEASQRELGFFTTKAATKNYERFLLAEDNEKITIKVSIYPPDNRRRDDDGMIGAFKHLRDGMADALGTDDYRFRCTYEICPPEKPGRVEVEIEL